ncbi:IQ and AAA domain-containing protein 1-like isoform X2 [Homarus americanus]|uniref:IQ and AAA domain-containing protein 1-like isoform X2 n=1 Tax=Homarus americanus TaxID=6706 RepID=UPI001C444943|nr:IQ and AAA domain-containing protein 1-like isoform X2 [Homarus americanus]
MSFRTFNALWSETQDELTVILEKDQELQGTFHPDQRAEVAVRVRRVYVLYLGAARKLNVCHDQLLHPQKRLLLRRLLDATIGRIVELKHELVSLDLSDIQHCDDIMVELNLTPQDLVVPIPTYIRRERLLIISERNALIDDCLRRAGLEAVSEDEVSPLTVSEAIMLLQRHERAKQGRAKADHRRDLLARQERDRGRGRQQVSKEVAVVRLQAVTRGMLARRKVNQMRLQEELFLGLRPDPTLDRSWGGKLEKVQETRYLAQEDRKVALDNLQKRIQTKIVYEEGNQLLTSMEDKIREWIFQKKHETGKFPDLPEEDEGGSSAIVGMARPDDDAISDDARSLERKSERERAREQAKQKKKKEEEEKAIVLRPSSFVTDIQGACDQFQDVWSVKDIEDNTEEHPEEDMIETEQRARVEVEIRRQVDYLMRQEIQRLKEDVEGEKRGAKKKKRVKKGGKKGRKRKEKDLTPDRTTESLFEELVLNGIIKKVPEVRLSELYGDVSLVGCEMVAKTKYPMPAIGDIKNILTEYVVLPLGVDGVHEQTQMVKSVLVCGPRGCGKTRLVHALAYESGATFMDLTATNIVGRYPGRAGLNMLTHLVMKVGRLLQPTLIMIDAADKMFLKKVPKTDKSDPRRLKKEMPRMLKSLGPEDKIVFVGISNAPWNCDAKSLSSVYNKLVMIQRPTFSARAQLWRHLITKNGVKLTPRLDIGGLARISDGYTSGHICSVASQVVTEQRLAKQNKTPLTALEFVVPLSKIEPIYREEEEAMRAWYQKTPIMKKRARYLEEELEAQGLKGKGAKKPDAKKPKGKKGKRKKKK